MAYGMNLGIKAAMGGGPGLPQGRSYAGSLVGNTYRKHGNSMRVGRPAAGLPMPAATGVDEAASMMNAAASGAASAASEAGSVRAQQMATGVPEPQEDPTEGVRPVGGGAMGLKPDFTARDSYQDRIRALDENAPTGFLARELGNDQDYRQRRAALIDQRNWAEKKAIEDAAYAQAADPRYRQWKKAGVTPRGEVVERNELGEERIPETEVPIGVTDFRPSDPNARGIPLGPGSDRPTTPGERDQAYRAAMDAGVVLSPITMSKIERRMDPGYLEAQKRHQNALELAKTKQGYDLAEEGRTNAEWDRRLEAATESKVAVKGATPGAAPKTATQKEPKPPKPKTYGDVGQRDEAIQKRYRRLAELEPDGGQYLDVGRKRELYAQAEKEVEAEVAAPASSGGSDGGWVPRKIKGKPVMARQLPSGQWEVKP